MRSEIFLQKIFMYVQPVKFSIFRNCYVAVTPTIEFPAQLQTANRAQIKRNCRQSRRLRYVRRVTVRNIAIFHDSPVYYCG